eukprot:COSAG01_NODE_27532_length_683_cov_1.316781_1_plen_113_part_10
MAYLLVCLLLAMGHSISRASVADGGVGPTGCTAWVTLLLRCDAVALPVELHAAAAPGRASYRGQRGASALGGQRHPCESPPGSDPATHARWAAAFRGRRGPTFLPPRPRVSPA